MMLNQIPNIITLTRIVAILPICWLLWQDAYVPAFVCLLLAGISDGLDGFLARRYGWFTRLGSMLDPVADKLLIVSLVIVLVGKGYLPIWLMWLIIGRDIVIVCGVLFYRWLTGELQIKPLLISKVNTALQILLLIVTLMHVSFFTFPTNLHNGLQWLVGTTSVLSGLSYVFLGAYYAFYKEVSI